MAAEKSSSEKNSPKPSKKEGNGSHAPSSEVAVESSLQAKTKVNSSVFTIILGFSILILCAALVVTVHKLNQDLTQERLERQEESAILKVEQEKVKKATKDADVVKLQAEKQVKQMEEKLNVLENQVTKLTEERNHNFERAKELEGMNEEYAKQLNQLQDQLHKLTADKDQTVNHVKLEIETLQRDKLDLTESYQKVVDTLKQQVKQQEESFSVVQAQLQESIDQVAEKDVLIQNNNKLEAMIQDKDNIINSMKSQFEKGQKPLS